MNIQRVREKDLTPADAEAILAVQHAAFPNTPEFVSYRWWHTPLADEELWFFGRDETGRVVCSTRVMFRLILCDGRGYRVAGIGNVASHPDVRGKGAGKACMQDVGRFIAESRDLDFGLLFTGPPTDGFYAKLGWKTIPNTFIFLDEKDRRQVSDGKGVSMIYPGLLRLDQWPAGAIDLNGRNW